MKLDILIVEFVLVAAVFLPYFIFILIGNKEQDKLKIKFSEEKKKSQLLFDEVDNWNNNFIGVDKAKGKILLVKKRKLDFTTELLDLKQIQACGILQEVGTVKINHKTQSVLQKLNLELKLYNGASQIVTLYDCEETYVQDYELKHAERWCRVINEIVAIRPTLNSAA